MAAIQRLPCLGTADEDVVFVQWLVQDGETIRRGQALAEIETLKAAFEVEAEHEGVLLRKLVEPGDRVPAGAALGVIGRREEALDEAALRAPVAAVPAAATPAVAGPVPVPAPIAPPTEAPPVAPAARRRAAELRVDVAGVRGTGQGGLVRAADVERAHAGRQPAATGTLDAEFLALVRADRAAFARLAPATKAALYRRAGAQLGADCEIGDGAVLLAERLVLGDGASIGADCHIEARQLVAGTLLHFGARCRVRCTKLTLGDNAFFAEDVEVGGGGALDPEAELIVGSHGFVGEHAHLNPCRPIRIGDEVVISRNAVLMTHSFGASVLLGYPNRFAGLTVGDGAQIGIGTTLFPGVEVGAGAIVMSGSFLTTSVPAGRMFGGVPARDLKAAARILSREQLAATARELVVEFARQLQLRGFTVNVSETPAEVTVTVAHDGRRHRLRHRPDSGFAPAADRPDEDVIVTLGSADAEWHARPNTVTAIDLAGPRIRGAAGPLCCAFREFLRKRGVRLHPRDWSYRGGWL